MDSSFLAFLGVSIFVIVTPGPDTALVIRNALLGGRAGGIFTALGVSTGQAIWVLATSIGLVALLVASEPVFLAVKLAGAAYLVVLGVQALIDALRASVAETVGGGGITHRLAPWTGFWQGLISDLGNPKMAVFFASVLPQFAAIGDTMFSELLLLGLVFCALALIWLIGYSVVVASVGDFLRRPRVRRVVEGVTGTVLVALGLRLATESR